MKAIIIGAGSGTRLGEYTRNSPKPLLKINGKPLIQYQIDLFKKNNIDEIYVIVGSHSEQFNIDTKIIKDIEHIEHNIFGSLFVASDKINNDVLISYTDIIYEEKILNQILNSKSDIGIAVDLDWRKNYNNRTMHPTSEAENVIIQDGKIIEIRKNINYENNIGEFLGVMKLTTMGSKVLFQMMEELKNYKGKFHYADSVKKAYLTDVIQEMIDRGNTVNPIIIKGKWCEIDTVQDLENTREKFS